jgi:hypothetical protein
MYDSVLAQSTGSNTQVYEEANSIIGLAHLGIFVDKLKRKAHRRDIPANQNRKQYSRITYRIYTYYSNTLLR